MAYPAVDSAALASYLTAAGTLVLAVATFAAVRSSNQSARIAEAALQEQRRPILAPSRFDDPAQKIMFIEGNWVTAAGGHAAVEQEDGVVYLAISLRNVGTGIAVCQGWAVTSGLLASRTNLAHTPLEDFHLQSRDLYVPAGDIGMWQGALRNPDDAIRVEMVGAIEGSEPITVELLYSDLVGRQRTISRFGLVPAGGSWVASMNRHWYLDWDGPRPEELTAAAAEAVFRDRAAATERRVAEADRDAAEPGPDPVETAESPRP